MPRRVCRWQRRIPCARAETGGAYDPGAPWSAERAFRGEGFTLGYPSAARPQVLDRDGDERSAVQIAGLPGCTSVCFLTVRTYDDPSRAGVAAWVRDLMHDDSVAAGEEDEPAYPEPPTLLDLGGVRALRLDRECEDCTAAEWYLARGDRVVGIELVMDGRIPRADQERIEDKLELLLRGFRWDHTSHEQIAPPAPPAGIQV
jgi:hypothetical protein